MVQTQPQRVDTVICELQRVTTRRCHFWTWCCTVVHVCGIDLVLPVYARMQKLSRRSVTAILIQVKSHKHFGRSIDDVLFDLMEPFGCFLRLLSEAIVTTTPLGRCR